ncbi:MAG: non-hydrolyzing UDP-N-acetylglucosamine 2-epimerase [Sphingosinicella sp.]|uniref:non-hydrolyzing UDP-N-acetylglucosamine 2-epimerase n=1 Tax=Sphingosinicella sp. TaxID=1917971 RepID=UPI004037C8A8
MKLLSVFGTRPEAVKMAPVLGALASEQGVLSQVCVTGQHRELLNPVLRFFGIAPDFDLALMAQSKGLNDLAARTIDRLDKILAREAPDRVIVQGDTTSAMAAALAADNRRIPVAHVEAGLRTYAMAGPWPEEANRRTIALHADLHFAPTAAAKANLAAERLHGEVFVTGNSGIDALHCVRRRLARDAKFRAKVDAALPPSGGRKLILVTAHRRESFGAPLRAICEGVAALARGSNVDIVWPLHPNPAAREPVVAQLGDHPNVHLVDPLDLPGFIRAMDRAALILTDSGGVQEEAGTLGKPVLVLRGATERPEGVAAGVAHLVGTDAEAIRAGAQTWLRRGRRIPAPSTIYGDGHAAGRIVDGLLGRPVAEFQPLVTAARDGLRQIG